MLSGVTVTSGVCTWAWRLLPAPGELQCTDIAVVEVCGRVENGSMGPVEGALKRSPDVRRVQRDMRIAFGTGARSLLRANGGGTSAAHRVGQGLVGLRVDEAVSAPSLWQRNYTGRGVRIAIFDSGLSPAGAQYLRNVESVTNWTDEPSAEDGVGHGTAVASIVAGTHPECPGIAQDATLLIYKVFNSVPESRTAWFLHALNHVLQSKVDILNLSIGGPDYLDELFVSKVRDLSASGVVILSGAGNRGPLIGSLLNPADQNDVIGVGGLGAQTEARALRGLPPPVASFSSRGPTLWELPAGAPRFKPDVVAPSLRLAAVGVDGTCAAHSGTSFACPVVTGASALLAGAASVGAGLGVPRLNPASLKILLMQTAQPVPEASLVEQGAGALSLLGAFSLLVAGARDGAAITEAAPSTTPFLWPPLVNLTSCPHFTPLCQQPVFAHAQPLVMNLTVLNPLGVDGWLVRDSGRWLEHDGKCGTQPVLRTMQQRASPLLDVRFLLPEGGHIWPWSGWVGVVVRTKAYSARTAQVCGYVTMEMQTNVAVGVRGSLSATATVSAFVVLSVVKTPPREERILFDLWHSLRYPPGFVPRDDLAAPAIEVFDYSGGDHPFTNYMSLSSALILRGYFVEVLMCPLTCFEGNDYAALLLADSEDRFTAEEIQKLHQDVLERALSVVVVADWWDKSAMHSLAFFDDGSGAWWTPATGGANLPALNELLASFGIALAEGAYRGELHIGHERVLYASGAVIARFPAFGELLQFDLKDEAEFMRQVDTPHTAALRLDMHSWRALRHIARGAATREAAVGGIVQMGVIDANRTQGAALRPAGRIAVFGDSTCMDDTFALARAQYSASILSNDWDCVWMIEDLVDFAARGTRPLLFGRELRQTSRPFSAASAVPLFPRAGASAHRMDKVIRDVDPANDTYHRLGHRASHWSTGQLRRPDATKVGEQPLCYSNAGRSCVHALVTGACREAESSHTLETVAVAIDGQQWSSVVPVSAGDRAPRVALDQRVDVRSQLLIVGLSTPPWYLVAIPLVLTAGLVAALLTQVLRQLKPAGRHRRLWPVRAQEDGAGQEIRGLHNPHHFPV